jgi:hypothetical protein
LNKAAVAKVFVGLNIFAALYQSRWGDLIGCADLPIMRRFEEGDWDMRPPDEVDVDAEEDPAEG